MNDWFRIDSFLNHAHPRCVSNQTPSLTSASLVFSVVTSRLSVEADTTVLMDSTAIIPATAKNTIFL